MQKIKVFYLARPNMAGTTEAVIHEISVSSIHDNTNGVVFGVRGNGRMSNSARLLLSIFKNREANGNGGFQDWLYQLIKIKNKNVNLYFFNDAMEDLAEPAANYYYLDTVRRDGGLRVWPASWHSSNVTDAGCINLGEYFFRDNLRLFQTALLELVTAVQFNSNRSLHPSGMRSFNHPGLNNELFLMASSVMDRRLITDQGVSSGIIYTYDTAYQRLLYRWFRRPSFSIPNVIRPGTISDEDSRFGLMSGAAFPGLSAALQEMPPDFSDGLRRNFRWLNFSTLASQASDVAIYKIRNEVSQALIYNMFIRCASLSTFMAAVKEVSVNYRPEGIKTKFVMMLEQMCRKAMGDLTTAQVLTTPPADKDYLAPIVMIHILSGRRSDFDYTKFTESVGQNFPREIFDLYTPEIRASVQAISINADDPDMFYSIREQIRHILNT